MVEKPMKPARFAEHQLLSNILEGRWPPETILPSERILAEQIGVTRPTLRETLQRLSREGWVTISHGKPTVVNDYWKKGGLGLLATLARYGDFLPENFVDHLLGVRSVFLPAIAELAAEKAPESLLDHLGTSPDPSAEAEAFAEYDWKLHLLMAEKSGNPVFLLILNDFGDMFKEMGAGYFSHRKAKEASSRYYDALRQALEMKKGGSAAREKKRDGTAPPKTTMEVAAVVKTAMEEVVMIWQELSAVHAIYHGQER